MISSRVVVRRPPSALHYSVLHGVGTVANALSVGDAATTFDRFQVDVAALVQTEDNFGLPEIHRSARMIWNEVDVSSPRLEICVQTKMLRHLVELYVKKRIDTVAMSMKIAVQRQLFIDTSADSELLPLLDKDGHLYFRRISANCCRCTLPSPASAPWTLFLTFGSLRARPLFAHFRRRTAASVRPAGPGGQAQALGAGRRRVSAGGICLLVEFVLTKAESPAIVFLLAE